MRTIVSACTRHCSNGCSLLVNIGEDGHAVISGNPDHPYTAGRICAKTARFMERLNSPERILTPQIRDKATGTLRPASWDEALDLICARITELRDTPGDMLHVFYYASFGALFEASKHLFALLGAAKTSGSMCLGAGAHGLHGVLGALNEPDYFDLPTARHIVNWGRDIDAQTQHVGRIVADARAKGTRVLALSPDSSAYASWADEVVTVRPGMDRFIAAAAARMLLDEGRLDQVALARAANPEPWLAMLRGLDVAAACEAAGVSLETARTVAGAYADGPTASLLGRGLQRYAFGAQNAAFLAALAASTGNMGRQGGGIYFCTSDRGGIGSAFPAVKTPAPRTFRFADLGGDLARAREAGSPVRFVWVEGTNIVTQGQDSQAIRDELTRAFTVVVEPFPTDTTDCADVILPPALMLEWEDVAKASNHEWLHHSAQAFPPRGETRGNFEISRTVALRLGLPFPEAEEALSNALHGSRQTTPLAELRSKGFLRGPAPTVPFAGGVYGHPDGLCRLPERLDDEPSLAPGLPLRLLSLVQKRYLLSQIPLADQDGRAEIFLSATTLAGLGFASGDAARLVGERGHMDVVVRERPGLADGTVLLPRGGWLKRGRCANALTAGRETDQGGQAAYYDQWCRLERLPENGER